MDPFQYILITIITLFIGGVVGFFMGASWQFTQPKKIDPTLPLGPDQRMVGTFHGVPVIEDPTVPPNTVYMVNKPKPQSKVSTYPKPADIAKQKEKQAIDSFMDDLVVKDRGSGSFKL